MDQKDQKKLSSRKRIQQLKKTIKKSQQLHKPELEGEVIVKKTKIEQKEIKPSKVTIVLENAGLYLRRMKEKQVLLNFEDHSIFIEKKLNRDPENYRPDIIHQSLLALMDSPLNKAGFMQVLINTHDNQLIKINPETKIPRTYKRFSGMIAQLLDKQKIKTGEENKVLLEVVRGDVPVNVPEDRYIIATSHKGRAVDFRQLIIDHQDKELVIVIGALSKGSLECKYADETVSISRYQLSTTNCISKIVDTFEDLFSIL